MKSNLQPQNLPLPLYLIDPKFFLPVDKNLGKPQISEVFYFLKFPILCDIVNIMTNSRDSVSARLKAMARVQTFSSDDLINLALDRMDTLPPQPATEWSEDFLVDFAVTTLTNDYLNGLVNDDTFTDLDKSDS